MKPNLFILSTALLLSQLIEDASAQQTPQRGQTIQIRPETATLITLRNPLMAVLDLNRDGSLSKDEIDNASASLRALDKNRDGRIDATELRPVGQPNRLEPTPETTAEKEPQLSGFTRLIMESDKNKDGKVTKAELPENMRRIFENADANHDGFISVEEAELLGNPRTRGVRGND